MTFGVALVGSGIFAREEHLPALKSRGSLALKAVYSRSLQSAQTLVQDTADANSITIYSEDSGAGRGFDDLLLRKDIEAVIIALPISTQPYFIKKTLSAGKHVLSEKPVSENTQLAQQLISWYEQDILPKGITWAVAENARFWNTASHIRNYKQVARGQTLTFRARMQTMVQGGKYFETSWRKTPTHQGGFVLDAGVHLAAAVRMLLDKEDPIVNICAYTTQLQAHLPPVDTIEAIAKTKKGGIGSISISSGTTITGVDYQMGWDNGFISVTDDTVNVNGELKSVKKISGVVPEVAAWAEGLLSGRPNALQSPREALADLEIIEACLQSGAQDGRTVELVHQEM